MYKTMLFCRNVLFCLSVSVMMLPRPARSMTLEEAVAYAMDHNRDVLAVKERVRERKGQVTEARADALPQLDLSMTAFRIRDPGFLNSTFGQSLLSGEGGGEDFPIPLEAILPRPQTFYATSLTFSQPLFTWGKVRNAVKLAKLGTAEVDAQLETTRQEIAYQVIGAYYNVLLAEETVVVYEKSMEVQQRYLNQTKDFIEVGDATQLDLLRARSQLAATKPDLLRARHDVVLAKKGLNFLLGRELDTAFLVASVEDPGEPTIPKLESVTSGALARRPDLRQLNLQVQMFHKTVNVYKADFRPRADLTGAYGFSTIRTEDQFDRNFEAWRVSLEVSVPLFDGFRNRGIVNQYRSLRVQKEIETEQLAEQVRLDARQSIASLDAAAQVYEASRLALASAEEEERVTAETYEQDLATSYELLDSNQKTIQARTEFLTARYNLLLQIAALKKVLGTPVDKLFSPIS